MKVVGLLDDGSVLSTEMGDMCANLPIYVIVRRAIIQMTRKLTWSLMRMLMTSLTRKPGISLK